MSTDNCSLPVRDCLDMGLSLCAVQVARRPRPAYRVLFRLHMRNAGHGSVRLVGRKWTLRDRSGATRIIEAERVFNQHPVLAPDAVFGYSGCHTFDTPPTGMEVRFFGTDARNAPFITPPLIFPRACLQVPGKA